VREAIKQLAVPTPTQINIFLAFGWTPPPGITDLQKKPGREVNFTLGIGSIAGGGPSSRAGRTTGNRESHSWESKEGGREGDS